MILRKATSKLVIIILCFIGLTFSIQAQDSVDKVYKLGGEVLKGKVTGIKPDVIEFVYQGEDLKYEIAKSEISKIQFASGREQVFNT